MLPYLHIGPVMLQLPGLALLVGLWLGLEVATREAPRVGVSGDVIGNMVLLGVVGGIIGGRLGYAARYPDAFLKAPLSLLALNPQTIDIATGVLVGLAAAWLYGQRKRLPLRPALDALAPGLVVLALFVGVAHVFSGNAYGIPTTLPWGIELWGAKRHPTQLYEVFLTAGAFFAIWRLSRRPRGNGTLFLWAVGMLAGIRLFVEAFRGDSVTWFAGIRGAQVIAWLVLLAAVWLFPQWENNAPPVPSNRRRERKTRRNKG